MMKYKVLLTEEARKELKEMNSFTSRVILGWMRAHLIGCYDPRTRGRGLSASNHERWRYTAGNWRIIADINDNTGTILILTIRYKLDASEMFT